MDFFPDDIFNPKDFDLQKFIDGIGNLDDISSMELLDKICVLSKKDREVALNNDTIKNKLKIGLLSESRNNQWYYYREILTKISASEFLSLYDTEFLNKYFMIHQGEYLYRFWASLCEKNINTIIDLIIEDDGLLDNFLKESNNFESLFENLDYNLLVKLLYKLQDKGSDFNYDFLTCISKEYQYLLLQDSNINDETLIYLLNSFYNEVKTYFFVNDSRSLYLYDRFDIPSFANSGVKFSDNILKKKEFFELLKDRSLIIFRKNINNIEKFNNPIYIEDRIDKYYEDILSLYSFDSDMFTPYRDILDNPSLLVNWDKKVSYLFHFDIIDKLTGLLKIDDNGNYYFDNNDELEVFLKNETSKKMSEIIIDGLFKDNIYNVWINVREMIRYNKGLDIEKKLLDNDKIDFYKTVMFFDNLSNIDKINFYNAFKEKNVNLMFYNDIRMLKDYAYDRIKEELFSINNNTIDAFLNNGVSVYDARNINYSMLVRTQAQYREESHYPRNCYSIISNENTSVFGEEDYGTFLYGYNGFDNDMVLHMFESDSFSSGFRENSSRFANRIMTVEELVKSSHGYSEIQLINKKVDGKKHKYSVKKPDFIVAFDNLRDVHIEEAKRLNIPIVIIKRQLLKNKINGSFNQDMDSYVESIFSENEHRVVR